MKKIRKVIYNRLRYKGLFSVNCYHMNYEELMCLLLNVDSFKDNING